MSETRTWNVSQISRIQELEKRYLRGACGVNRMDDENNESVYGKFGMSVKSEGMNRGVIEVVKCSICRWFGHKSEGMNHGVMEVVKCSICRWFGHLKKKKRGQRIYKSGVDDVGERKTPL